MSEPPPTLDASPDDASHAGVPVAAERERAVAAVVAACPYLAVGGRAWRSATADREHRCTAVAPPAALTLDKQRRLCLVEGHASCATFMAALETHPVIGARSGESGGAHVTRWAIARTTPVVLDRGRVPAAMAALSPFKRGGQATLGGLMVVALVALFGGRLGNPDDRPAGAVDASATPTIGASPTVDRTATSRPSVSPPASVAPSPTLPPTVVTTPEPTPITYTVQSGDTLSAIASRHGTTVAAIVALNGITDPSRLRIGQVLQIPPSAAP